MPTDRTLLCLSATSTYETLRSPGNESCLYLFDMTTTVSFRDFWPQFNPLDFFVPLLQRAVGGVVEVVPAFSKSDIEIVSVFQRRPTFRRALVALGRSSTFPGTNALRTLERTSGPSPKAKVSIWYTGENLRPAMNTWTRTWSFDSNSRVLGNWHLPIWWFQFPELVRDPGGELPAENRTGMKISLSEASSPRDIDVTSRDLFCCSFLNWNTSGREALVRALTSIDQVDIFGRLSGNVVARKMDVAMSYRFMLCAENDQYPGYVTEKIFDAWAMGCVPIWSGIDREGYLNPSAFVNAAEFNSHEAMLEAISNINDSLELRAQMANQPILNLTPDLQPLLDDLHRLLTS